MDEEAVGIAKYILCLQNDRGIAPGQILVLSPRRLMGYRLRDAFVTLGIPTHSFYHEEALDDDNAQRAFSYLTLLAHPDDRVALRYLLGLESATWRDAQYRKLQQHCEEAGEAPWEALERLLVGDLSIRGMTQLKKAFAAIREEWEVLQGLAINEEVINRLFPVDETWAELLRAVALDMDLEEATLESIHSHVRQCVTEPEVPQNSDVVRIMSLHKSKGLTSQVVIVTGCIEGLIPTILTDLTPAEQNAYEKEQRRLFYVAMTRGRRTLVLSSVQRVPLELAYRIGVQFVHHTAADARTIGSRFLAELGPNTPMARTGVQWLNEMGIT